MAKVDWITWKTNPKEIINPELLEEKLNSYLEKYDTNMNKTVYETVRNEMLNGGLDKESFTIMGISPSNEAANNILNKIEELNISINDFKIKVINSAKQQKELEKKQLIEAIEEKIEQEESVKSKTTEKDIIEIYESRINILKERLEVAKAL